MILAPGPRRLALTVHVISSIGWFGAVAAFLALAIAGITSQDAALARACYLVLDLLTWFVIVPLALVALLSGVISSVGTRWGLFRYYWVVLKLIITLFATFVLLIHTQPIRQLTEAARQGEELDAGRGQLRLLMVVAAAAALLALIILTALSVYKPRGLTPYGQRKEREQRKLSPNIDAAT